MGWGAGGVVVCGRMVGGQCQFVLESVGVGVGTVNYCNKNLPTGHLGMRRSQRTQRQQEAQQ